MRILAIRIKNLASLDGITEINFDQEPLCSAGIFAITGATGAGKSTILDALCLALYAKTPRYRFAENGIDITDVKGSTIKQDDVRSILRDGTSDGFAEVDFAGIDNQHYRTIWSVRRARNKADGNLQAFEMALKNISTQQIIPGKKSELLLEVERLVGLNFEQFTRSVLLAQGDFTAFLKAGRDEKSSLLEKLTGTHIYSEISKKVFENHREQQQKLRDLTVLQEGISTLTQENLSALQEQKLTLDTAIKSGELQTNHLRKEIDWHTQWELLQSSVRAAQSDHSLANDNQTNALPRLQHIQQIDRIQTVKPNLIHLQNTTNQVESKSTNSEKLHQTLIHLQQQKEVCDSEIDAAANNLNIETQEYEIAKPLLEIAKRLDVQLLEKKEQITQTTNDTKEALQKQNKQQLQLQEKQKALTDVNLQIDKYCKWIEANKHRSSIAEQITLILSKLDDAANFLQNIETYASQIQNAEKDAAVLYQTKKQLEQEYTSIQDSLQPLQTDYTFLQNAVATIPIQQIENEKISIDTVIENTVKAGAHWQLLYQAISDNNAQQQLLIQTQNNLQQQSAQLATTARSLEIKKAERGAHQKSLERARLIAAERVEQLRQQLEPETPCPVCGSTEHPYATHHPDLALVLNELETNYNQSETNYNEALTSHSKLQESCSQKEKSILDTTSNITEKTQLIQRLEILWKAFEIYDKSTSIGVSATANWIEQQLRQQKEMQQQLQHQIEFYYKQKRDLEKSKANLDNLQEQFTKNENATKDVNRTLQSLVERKNNDTKEMEKAQTQLQELQQTLSNIFTSEAWYQNWQSAPKNFLNSIKDFATKWNDYKSKWTEHSKQSSTLEALIKEIQQQFENTNQEVAIKNNKQLSAQQQYDDLYNQRKTIFNGEAIVNVEERFKNTINAAQQSWEQKTKETGIVQNDITKFSAQKEQLDKDIISLSTQKDELTQDLHKWLIEHNEQYGTALTEAKLHQLLAFTADWLEEEKIELRNIDDAVVKTQSVLKERSDALAIHLQHKYSDKPLEELQTSLNDLINNLNEQKKDAYEVYSKIEEDQKNKYKIGNLLQQIETQSLIVENWAKLNEIIGSSDGKKFRQLAQEYTLDILLSYANIHLGGLSSRYILQRIPDSLGLQVIDQDMGDEVRTVYSLSGGESFLVSLALALGLASLSSNRMKVESLFIDEGFGSLDPATLNIAMDALERLHNQGRKVGVISHVQEMTERIPVQIKVSKQQSGRSNVEVWG